MGPRSHSTGALATRGRDARGLGPSWGHGREGGHVHTKSRPAGTVALDFWPPQGDSAFLLLCGPPSLWPLVLWPLGSRDTALHTLTFREDTLPCALPGDKASVNDNCSQMLRRDWTVVKLQFKGTPIKPPALIWFTWHIKSFLQKVGHTIWYNCLLYLDSTNSSF